MKRDQPAQWQVFLDGEWRASNPFHAAAWLDKGAMVHLVDND